MKIAIRGGHNYQATGAVALLNEVEEDRILTPIIINYLKGLGHEVLDVTPGNCDVNSDLRYGVSKANTWGADLFVSIHFNKAYSSYNGAIGSEVCVYSKSKEAQRVCDKLSELGFINRGQKIRQELYELKSTKMNAMIIEVCFVEATKDVELYKSLGHNRIARAIAEGIADKQVVSSEPKPSNSNAYTVKITGDVLNVRKGPGTNYAIATTVKQGEVYTIVEEQNGFGKLKSGAGWISLEFTSKNGSSASKTLKVGSKVKITGSKYATGQSIPDWVKARTYTVQELSNNKALIKEITSWVYTKDLILV